MHVVIRGGITSEEKNRQEKQFSCSKAQLVKNSIKYFIMKSENNIQSSSKEFSDVQDLQNKSEEKIVTCVGNQGVSVPSAEDSCGSLICNPMNIEFSDNFSAHQSDFSQPSQNQTSSLNKDFHQLSLTPELQSQQFQLDDIEDKRLKELKSEFNKACRQIKMGLAKIQKYFKNGQTPDKDELTCQVLWLKKRADEIYKKHSKQ